MTVVTLSDRPKSVRNRCVIEVFGGVFVFCVQLVVEFSVGLCHRTESDLLLFLLKMLKIHFNINIAYYVDFVVANNVLKVYWPWS